MMNQKTARNHTLIGVAVFTAIVIGMQMLGAFIRFGSFSISLVLLPIVVGAALYGAGAGAWLGFVFGMVVLLTGDADALMSVNAPATVFCALIKGVLAGFVSGLVYKTFSRKSPVLAVVLAAVACPVVNTGVFLIGDMLFFLPTIAEWGTAAGYESVGRYMILELTGNNFLLELLLNMVLSPVILMLIYLGQRGKQTWHISLSEKLYFLITWIILVFSLMLTLTGYRGTDRQDFLSNNLIVILVLLIVTQVISMILMRFAVTRPIGMLTKATKGFASDNEGYKKEDVITLPIRAHDEVGDLYHEIQFMQERIVEFTENITRITAERERIDAELNVATQIQVGMLPRNFEDFSGCPEFDLYASMDTAKEVGGDFYDFYFLDERHLAFLIADVSGKGVPAAMFMMTSKTILRDYAERGDEPKDVFINANNKLNRNNDSDMFLTAWMGFLDIDTGLVRFVNAGHNAPVLIRNQKAVFVEQKRNLMLAIMEGIQYREQTLQLEPGDFLYLYTDGVTEACRKDETMFGNERLLEVLSDDFGTGDDACRKICESVRRNVDVFVEDADQFDDITQFCLYYSGNKGID